MGLATVGVQHFATLSGIEYHGARRSAGGCAESARFPGVQRLGRTVSDRLTGGRIEQPARGIFVRFGR